MRRIVGLITLAASLAATSASDAASDGISSLASLNSLLHAAPVRRAAGNPTTFTGNIALTLTIDIATSAARISRDSPVKCILNANVHNADYTDSVAETSQVTVAVSGSQAVCKLLIPYSWTLYDAPDDLVYLGYTISYFDQSGNGRTTYVQMPTVGVPANGANLTYSRNARV